MVQIPSSERGKLPKFEAPARFTSDDGRTTGWRVAIPGGRPLATPAVADGRLFVGGGFGSYEFYALDAETGQLIWQYQTSDDGPTAAVVVEEYVVFNTESCELEVLTVTGESVWKRWLGDPLMSMPAVVGERVFMAYPDSGGDGRHYLACFDLKSGTPLWKQPISGEIITAPVLADDCVYLTTLDGTLYCFQQADGRPEWQDAINATSSPVVREGKCYFSQREEVPREDAAPGTQQMEQCASRGTAARSSSKAYSGTRRQADYLDHAKRAAGSAHYKGTEAADGFVGFAFSKGDAKIHQAMKNLGQAHVSSIWSYQGSKPFISGNHLYGALGDTIQSVHVDTEQVAWKSSLRDGGEGGELLDSLVTPPCLVNRKVFLGTRGGEVHCLAADSGEPIWRVRVGEPIVFQPAIAQGHVYVSTESGSLFCLETEDAADDDWLMWGATAAHNGLEEAVATVC
jgi:outer membrane protein assembly factor BamB